MTYSFRIEQAIRAATILHQGQYRKGSAPYPYISHLFAVSCIVADYTKDEDIIIASLLHDTLEDTDYTAKELENDFGERVRAIVEGITEPSDTDDGAARKRGYIRKLKHAPIESLLVCAADKVHNMRSIVEEYQTNVGEYLIDFGGTLEERLSFYEAIRDILNLKLESDIIHEFNHVFEEYKKFTTEGAGV